MERQRRRNLHAVMEFKYLVNRMSQNFDTDKARKEMPRRPQNVRYEVRAGQYWNYFDAEREGVVRWYVEATHEGMAKLVKKSGVQVGYADMYAIEKMAGRRWRLVNATDEQTDVLWACPHCGKDKPIEIGDYMCVDCRQSLDR